MSDELLEDEGHLLEAAREKIRVPALLSVPAIVLPMLQFVVVGLAAGVIGSMVLVEASSASSSAGGVPAVGMVVVVLVVAVFGLLFGVLPLLCHGVAIWMAWQLRGPGWILGAGIVAMVAPILVTMPSLGIGGSLGCLCAVPSMIFGLISGILLILASQDEVVRRGCEAAQGLR